MHLSSTHRHTGTHNQYVHVYLFTPFCAWYTLVLQLIIFRIVYPSVRFQLEVKRLAQ